MDDDAFADVPDPDAGIGVIGAIPPELAVVVAPVDVLDTGSAAVGGVSVGPLKFIGCCPASICGVTT